MSNSGAIHFNVVDADESRVAMLQAQLRTAGHDVTVFRDAHDAISNWPTGTVILAEDSGTSLRDLLVGLKRLECLAPVVGYSERPSARGIVYAIMDGASDYLRVPASVAEIELIAAQSLARRRTCAAQIFGEQAMYLIRNVADRGGLPSTC